MDRVSGRERGVRVGSRSARGMTKDGEGTPKMEAGTHRPAGEVEALIPRHGLVYLHHGVAPRPEHPPRQRVVVSPGLILIPEGELRGLSGAGRERSQRVFEGAHWCDGPVRASRSIGRERRREASERASSRGGHGWLVTRRLREKRSAGRWTRARVEWRFETRDVMTSIVIEIWITGFGDASRRHKDGRARDGRTRDRRDDPTPRRSLRSFPADSPTPSRGIAMRSRVVVVVFQPVAGPPAGPAR